ncbi:MAG: TldD/PmbA family protein [Chloroflexi bacterium]|nr:TldD/PmbA family protein [Chloroflexota bacterium]
MLGKEAAARLIQTALEASTADQTEVFVYAGSNALTRYANSAIHQNVTESAIEVKVRVALGSKLGVASTNRLTKADIRKVVESATTIARLQRENDAFHSFPTALAPPEVAGYSKRTATCSPEERADVVGEICGRARAAGMQAFGAFTTSLQEFAVANSLGVSTYFAGTTADLHAVVMTDNSSGYAAQTACDVADIDSAIVAAEAVDKASRGRNPVDLASGEYEVVLDEYVTVDMLAMLAVLGLGAKAVQEKRSFLTGKLGQPIMGPNVTIWDDGLNREGLPLPFDFEGVPKSKVVFVDRGIASGMVYDSLTATRDGVQSTGHALPAPNTLGPLPLNLFMAGGDATKGDLIRSVKRGLWVTRFWYTRPVQPLSVMVTGMTRDGTFLIENGEVTRAVRSARYTQSYVEALNNVELLTKDVKLLKGELFGAFRVPALKINYWRFQGSSAD